ncbi:uncharacterized protein LOC127259112 [Andrographis paniculata]|uniref:uncharacterized protein LOC127259112 n=1 Tax=Andrographis paniculata TaxID=175694 RepID=UPI0021E91D7B|nr:uncharacterized protein LOC127259112 [Andrographis paniculata]
MENIKHHSLKINGITMHVAEAAGDGAAVLLLHGFPELWYSWRHQMLHLAAKGYRAIAPDLRGYGDTEAPPSPSDYSVCHLVGDLVALLDALGLEQVFLVGHDWGAAVAWWFCLFRPDRIKALVNMSVQFHPRNPQISFLQMYRDVLGDGFYICRFQEEGEAEKAFESVETAQALKSMFSMREAKPLIVPKEVGMEVIFQAPAERPPWMTAEDLDYFAGKFKQTGFTGGLNYYRALNLDWECLAPWQGAPVSVPVKFLIGDQDLTYHVPGVEEYINGGGMKKHVPNLQEVVVMEGVAHFINQEKPEEVSHHISEFIAKFC